MIASAFGSAFMRSRSRRSLTLLLAALVLAPALSRAQEPSAAAAAPGPVTGSWEGWAKLTNDWPGQSCRYDGSAAAPSVRLDVAGEAGHQRGTIAIDLAAEPGSACPPLRKRYVVDEVIVAAASVTFADSGGNEWTLALRRSGSVMQGLLAWRQGGPDQPLAEGFTSADGLRPLSRLSGEVRLRRAEAGGADEEPGASEASAAPAAKTGVGKHLRNLGFVLGANAVGIAGLYAVNKIGKGSSSSGVLTCSPRVCIVGAPGAPCFCEGSVVSGAVCGTTTGGAPLNAECDGKSVPCQAGLSCNSNRCEDKFGRCPY